MEEKIKIVYEDSDLVVVEKPAGWVTTMEGRKNGQANHKYLEDWVKTYFPNHLEREGIVHRLDKNTSGLVVVAKNEKALEVMRMQFKNRKVVKKYTALVSGDFPQSAEIKMPIGRSSYGLEKFAVHEEGKMAWTVFKRQKRLDREGKRYSLLEVSLKTGRTHQIRVHLSYLRYPIVGDRLYGGEMRMERQFLHATNLRFNQPITGQTIELNSPLPVELLEELEKYEEI